MKDFNRPSTLVSKFKMFTSLPKYAQKTAEATGTSAAENTKIARPNYFFNVAQNFARRPTPLAMISSLVA